jgi:GT2 family glycosyltransferase
LDDWALSGMAVASGGHDSVAETSKRLSVGVLICSYQRPESLLRGLNAQARQHRQPDDIIVVVRQDDSATLAALASRQPDGLPLRVMTVCQPGTVHALNTGLEACRTDVLAITDDDTVPHPDWLARINAHFLANPLLGGLGGRDWCHDGKRFDDRSAKMVGQLRWFGKTVGNHHLGVGSARVVDFLKGANMSYRREAFAKVRFDARLRGSGAQASEDLAFSTSVKRAGWALMFDPLVAVDHYAHRPEAPRYYSSIAVGKDLTGLYDCGHNEVVAIWPNLTPIGRAAYVPWSFLVGTGASPGIVQAIRYTPRLGFGSWRRFAAAQRGKAAGLATIFSNGRGDRPLPGRASRASGLSDA